MSPHFNCFSQIRHDVFLSIGNFLPTLPVHWVLFVNIIDYNAFAAWIRHMPFCLPKRMTLWKDNGLKLGVGCPRSNLPNESVPVSCYKSLETHNNTSKMNGKFPEIKTPQHFFWLLSWRRVYSPVFYWSNCLMFHCYIVIAGHFKWPELLTCLIEISGKVPVFVFQI